MFAFLITVLILDSLFLTAVVLLQAGQGGGLASLGGGATEKVLGGRQATTLLTKATWVTGGVLLGLSLILSLMSGTGSGRASAVQQQLQQQVPAPAELPPLAPPAAETPPGGGQ